MTPLRAVLAAVCFALTGCSTVEYYAQAIRGHLELTASQRPIDEVLADPSTAPELAEQLRGVSAMREFAVSELALPDNGSYRSYAALDRDYVVYSVVAAPALSLEPVRSCFPVVGCVSYRGYYRLADANRAADRLRQRGLDVYVAPVPAYSTLGWFDDPVPSSLIHHSSWSLAGTLFHELAHQRIYIAGDTEFNEAYAVAVQREGVSRWLSSYGSEAERAAHARTERRREQFLALVNGAREQLVAVYALDADDADRLARKHEVLRRLRADYAELRRSWGGYRGYDRWFAQDVNNAKLALVATYNELVPSFASLIAHVDADMPRFHATVECLGELSVDRRRQELERLANAQSAPDRGSASHSSPCSSIAG